MKSKHKLISLLSIMMILSVLITACGAPTPTEAPEETSPPAATEAPTEAPAATEAPATEASGKMYEGVTVNLLTLWVRKLPSLCSAADQTLRN